MGNLCFLSLSTNNSIRTQLRAYIQNWTFRTTAPLLGRSRNYWVLKANWSLSELNAAPICSKILMCLMLYWPLNTTVAENFFSRPQRIMHLQSPPSPIHNTNDWKPIQFIQNNRYGIFTKKKSAKCEFCSSVGQWSKDS